MTGEGVNSVLYGVAEVLRNDGLEHGGNVGSRDVESGETDIRSNVIKKAAYHSQGKAFRKIQAN